MTKKNREFLLTATDIIKNEQLRSRVVVRILSRLSALGFWGYYKKGKI